MKFVKKLYFDLPGFGRVNAMEGGTLNVGGMTRETVKVDLGVVGFTEDHAEPSIDFKVKMSPGLSLRALSDLSGVDVTVQTDGGDTYILGGAWTSEPVSLSGGEIDMKMAGIRCDEVK
jgi:Phage tail tube protein